MTGATPRQGIIPARAGFTFSPARALECPAGSSPLARGLRAHGVGEGRVGGIIPARAGFTARVSRCYCAPWDHPRSRGVYAQWLPLVVGLLGSSPLARGLPLACLRQRVLHGIIPARAGFTGARFEPGAHEPDHPRSRGVYVMLHPRALIGLGSSPLARGLLGRPGYPRPRGRIIPARAGFTASRP